MAKIYKEGDADLGFLAGKTIAVIGYGNQGEAQAKNLRDSGVSVVVGVREGGASWKRASADGFKVLPIEKAAEEGDVVHMLVPDEVQAKVYEKIAPHLSEGNALSFSHGFNIYFKWIEPPDHESRTFGSDHEYIHILRRLYPLEVYVEAVRE